MSSMTVMNLGYEILHAYEAISLSFDLFDLVINLFDNGRED